VGPSIACWIVKACVPHPSQALLGINREAKLLGDLACRFLRCLLLGINYTSTTLGRFFR